MNEEIPPQQPMSSPANDIRKLKANGAATADELHQWLAKMRGKSPTEVLGIVASSSLMKSLVLATLLVAVIVFAWTAGAWGYENYVKKDAGVAAESEVTTTTPEAEPETETKSSNDVADPNKAEMPDLDLNDKQQVADKLGIGDSKEAPANINPLDNSDDDLLKGLE